MSSRLPSYVHKTSTGIYRYRRTVPARFRAALGGLREIKKSLGKDYSAAMKQWAVVHKEAEEALGAAAEGVQLTTRDEVIRALKAARVSRESLELLAADYVDEGLETFLGVIADELADEHSEAERAGRDPKVSIEAIRAINAAKLPPQTYTLASTLDAYLSHKGVGDSAYDRPLENRVKNLKGRMITAIGNEAVNRRSLQRFTRQEALKIRDTLLADNLRPTSVKRMLNVLKAALNHTILEQGLEIRNQLERLEIKGANESRHDRHPLTEEEIAALEPVMVRHATDILGTIWTLLRDTGARLSEVCRLTAADVHLGDVPYIAIRDGKGPNARREVPLSPEAVMRVSQLLRQKESDDSLFTRYARPRGNDAASQALMGRLRRVVTDRKKVVYSLRHRMKDRLRNTSCPENIAQEIMGHDSQGVAFNYGLGFSLAVKREALAKVWKK